MKSTGAVERSLKVPDAAGMLGGLGDGTLLDRFLDRDRGGAASEAAFAILIERHEEVREAGPERDDEQEDHRRSVDREQLVVRVTRDERLVRLRELRAHEQGEEPAGGEEDERRSDVEHADPLVVDRRDPRRDPAAAPVGAVRLRPNRHSATL